MKLILFLIFSIIDFNLILSTNLKHSDIFKGSNSEKNFNPNNKTKPINSTNNYSLKDQEDLEMPEEDKRKLIYHENKIESIGHDFYRQNKFVEADKSLTLEKQILFMASCLKGGLTSDEYILNAYDWAIRNKYFGTDKYDDLAKKISTQFKTNYQNDWKIRRSEKRQSCVIVSNQKIILDYNGLKNRAKKIFGFEDKK